MRSSIDSLRVVSNLDQAMKQAEKNGTGAYIEIIADEYTAISEVISASV